MVLSKWSYWASLRFHSHTAATHFGRIYAAYGGVFIILSMLWGWHVNKIQPDRFDRIGAAIAFGVGIMMYWPRGPEKWTTSIWKDR